MRIDLRHGDCIDVLATLPDNSVDAVVTDPPYGLANTDPKHVAETITRWVNGERYYLPSGRGFMGKAWDAFVPPVAVWDECLRVLKPGGHVLAFAGSRTVDLMTLGLRLAGFEIRDSIAWLYGSGFPKGKSQLKPAHEPIVMARKPLVGTVATNVLEHGTGALNVDGCRVGDEVRVNPPGSTNPRVAMGGGWREEAKPREAMGRWPANVLLEESQAEVLDEQANASRFFYVAKASKSERPLVGGVAHPTVKPVSLMQWLVRLVTPPNGVVLDPFAGSGTTVEACMREGFGVIAIEREADYLPLIQARIDRETARQENQ